MVLNIGEMVEDLSKDILYDLDLDESDPDTLQAVRALAYRWVQDKEETAQNILIVTLAHFQEQTPKLPREFLPGMAWAIESLQETIKHGLPVIPDEIRPEDFLPDPLEKYEVGSDLSLPSLKAKYLCGEGLQLPDGDIIACDRAPHSAAWWHISIDDHEPVVYARWRGSTLEIGEDFDLDEDEDDNEDD